MDTKTATQLLKDKHYELWKGNPTSDREDEIIDEIYDIFEKMDDKFLGGTLNQVMIEWGSESGDWTGGLEVVIKDYLKSDIKQPND